MNLLSRKWLSFLAIVLTALVIFACSSCGNHIRQKDRESGTTEISDTVEAAQDDYTDPQAGASESESDLESASMDDSTETAYNDYGEWDIP